MTNEIIRLIKNYLNDFTIETTPNIYNKYQGFSNLLEKNHKIYVTNLPEENFNNVVDTTKKLKLEGFDVVPHLPARTMTSKSQLEKYLGNLSEVSGCNKILYIGGGSKLKGMDQIIRERTNVPVYNAEDPLLSVVRGTGMVLEDIKKYEAVLI